MAFGQKHFQPSLANSFLMDVALYWFIHLKTPPAGFLSSHAPFGIHTDVYIFKGCGERTRYTWSHPVLRLWGEEAPLQCRECKSLKPWGKPSVDMELGIVTLVCGYCRYSLPPFVKQQSLKRYANGQSSRTDGEWYYESI